MAICHLVAIKLPVSDMKGLMNRFQYAAHVLVGGLLLVGYFASLPGYIWQQAPAFQVPEPAEQAPDSADTWHMQAASDALTPLVHAGSMVELADGRIRAFWFAGEREGGPNVGIHSALFDGQTGLWSDERRILDRHQVARQLGQPVRKLGNAVPVMEADGRLRLFVVAVSFAGWAASKLVVMESQDQGVSWLLTDKLVLSPLLEISSLVKGNPIRFDDGTLGLPVYHEFIGKFGELVRLDADNRVRAKARIGSGRKAIQPVLFVQSPQQASALLRNESRDQQGFAFASSSSDAGQHWQALTPSGLAAASAALGGNVLSPSHWLAAVNHNGYARDDLTLLETRDAGVSWQPLKVFVDRQQYRGQKLSEAVFLSLLKDEMSWLGVTDSAPVTEHVKRNKCNQFGCQFQYDYPFLLRARNGDIHMLFTWNKTLIGHAWWHAEENDLQEQLADEPVVEGGAL